MTTKKQVTICERCKLSFTERGYGLPDSYVVTRVICEKCYLEVLLKFGYNWLNYREIENNLPIKALPVIVEEDINERDPRSRDGRIK